MFYRVAVEQQGKGKYNEASEDKTKLPFTSSPLPCSFIPNRAWSSRMMIHRVRHTILMALLLFPHVLHHHLTQQSLELLQFQFYYFYFAMYLSSTYHTIIGFHLCAFYKELCVSLSVVFLS